MSAGAKPYCPECGKPATGNFCQHCGSKLGGRFCNQCGAKAGPNAAFCNQCGAQLSGRGARAGAGGEHRAAAAAILGGQNLAWWVAGIAMFVLIVVVGVSMVQPGPAGAPAAVQPGAAAVPGAGVPPDISNLTPREAADRLFNRVMTSASQGDSVGARAFIPMAVAAYEQARPLDNDGLFHLSLLNHTGMNLEAALANATEVLDRDPNHLLGLLAAAQAAAELGQTDAAAGYYERMLEVWDQERARALPEYQDHAPVIESARSEAEAFLAGR